MRRRIKRKVLIAIVFIIIAIIGIIILVKYNQKINRIPYKLSKLGYTET